MNYRSAMPVRRGGDPEKVSSVLQAALRSCQVSDQIERYNFVLKWPEIVGEAIAAKTRPECIRKNTLVIRVCSSSWAQELSFHKGAILARLKEHLPKDSELSDINFYVGGPL